MICLIHIESGIFEIGFFRLVTLVGNGVQTPSVKEKSFRIFCQLLKIVETYYENLCICGRLFRPGVSTIRTKFTFFDIKPLSRMRTVRNEENIAAVLSSVNEDREMSIRRRSQQLRLYNSTTRNILRIDLGLKGYEIELLQKLKPNSLGTAP